MINCNMKITIIIDDLDKPNEDPITFMDQEPIGALSYEIKRDMKRSYAPGKLVVKELVPGPINATFSFRGIGSKHYTHLPGD